MLTWTYADRNPLHEVQHVRALEILQAYHEIEDKSNSC